MKRLPPIPRVVRLPCGPIKVVSMKEPRLEGKRIAGASDWGQRRIVLDNGLGRTASWLTLEHEKVHAILADAGIILPKKHVEDVCNAIAAARVAEMVSPKSRSRR